jgi:hypothetical protein
MNGGWLCALGLAVMVLGAIRGQYEALRGVEARRTALVQAKRAKQLTAGKKLNQKAKKHSTMSLFYHVQFPTNTTAPTGYQDPTLVGHWEIWDGATLAVLASHEGVGEDGDFGLAHKPGVTVEFSEIWVKLPDGQPVASPSGIYIYWTWRDTVPFGARTETYFQDLGVSPLDTDWFCTTKDDVTACLEGVEEYFTYGGYVVNSGPHADLAACQAVCAEGCATPPNACATAKTHCLEYVLDGSCSEAFCGFIITDWDWSGDVTGTGEILTGTFGSDGVKTITLVVTDSDGKESDPLEFTLLVKPLEDDLSCNWGGGGGGGNPNPGGGPGYCTPANVPNAIAELAGFGFYNPSLLRFPTQYCGGTSGFEQHSVAPEFRTRIDEFPGSESRISYDENGRRVVEISSMVFDEAAKDEWEAFLGLTDNGAKSFLYFDTARHILDAEVIGVSDGIETEYQLTFTRTFLEQSKTLDVFYPDEAYPATYHPQFGMMAAMLAHATQFLTLLMDGEESVIGWAVSRGTEAAPGGLIVLAGAPAPGTVISVAGHFYLRMIIESPAAPMLRAIGSGQYELATPLRLIETEEVGNL